MQVELKKIKIAKFLSEETVAFKAQLWVDGEHIAEVSNEGRGGNNMIRHFYDGNDYNTLSKVKAFHAWCKAQPPHVDKLRETSVDKWGSLSMDADLYISLMIEDYEKEQEQKRLGQQLKRWCKTKTVIKLEGDEEGNYLIYKRPYSAGFAQRIRSFYQRHPDTEPKLVEIVNERFIKVTA